LTKNQKTTQTSSWIAKRAVWQWIISGCTWIALIVALAHPQLANPPEKTVKTVRNFMIAADISFSMNQKDWVVGKERFTRWQAVRDLMKEFVSERKSDQVGLIFFGSNAFLQAPLTSDLAYIDWELDQTEVGMAGQMTGIGNAIGLALEVLDRDSLDQKVVLLLTDGVESGSDITARDAAQIAKQDSVKIYTIGIGDPNAKNADLDEATLQYVAEQTGGKYFRAIDAEALSQVYQELDALEPIELEEEKYREVESLHRYPLLVALGFSSVLLLFTLTITSWKRLNG
jgi:Ca-activated chloride channel family protein